MQRILMLLLIATLPACMSFPKRVTMTDVSAASAGYVVDKTVPDDYPSYPAGEGNIYSCRYGIHHVGIEEFSPPKAVIFGSLLLQDLPGIAQRHVVLERFDVYHNLRLRLLNFAGRSMGGIIGHEVARVGKVNKDVFTYDKLLVDVNPGSFTIPEENMVGCDKAREGEYYASQISGGHDVIVTWLTFKVDATEYRLRTFYQFQPATPADVGPAIADAVRMSVAAAASLVQEEPAAPAR